ncbi:non-ribosomal peptide synthetase/type I polyketide synthase [Microcoleus sp. BROC3]|uniref:non-ribosomal peptide synthetase/type I polyketide synthase n=1 Tax=Microcoleus sp. BROC3 TaxID=3055323 RepID=UPI002FD4E1C0
MLDVINRYLHGFVAVPVILACRKKGLFELLQHQGSLTREQIVESLGANGGHLQVALRMIRSLNWLERNEVGQYSLTDESQLYKKIPEEILDLYHLPFESYLMGEQPSGLLKNWISRSIQRWNVDDPIWEDFLDGILVIPILLALHKHNLLVEDKHKPLFSQLSAPVREELYELFTSKGWALRQEDRFCLTDVGRFIVGRALITGTTASYTPMLSRMSDVLFGDCQAVFSRDTLGHESHVDRTLNVVASGFQHEKYFADVEDIILSIFNQLPLEEQPKYVVDMGCGDGTLLKRVYETIRSKSARGKLLARYPLCAIGVDYNEASITATARTLADIPHLVLKGDIGDPEQMIASLKSHGIHDSENILHIRSFLDHDRPFIPPQNLEQVQVRSHLPYQGVYVAPSGDFIPPHIMVQSLVEHLERWSKVVTKQGLIILEVHCLEPDVVNRFLDKSENLHFDAIQAFSSQHLVEADVFLMAAAEVGLFPNFEFTSRYPKIFPFTRITLNFFEKKPYNIRHPHLSDLDALVNLEAKCWPEHLRAGSDEIRQRIERFPNGHCVLEMDGQVVGVMYSQRISSADILKNVTYGEVPSLYVPQGPVVQLLAVNILPEMQVMGLGDQLREFMLQLCTLKGGIERVVGVTRCKNYVSHAHIPIEEYIHQRNELGQLLDPILRFHSEAGATIKGIIPNYRPEDVDNLGNGVEIEYDIHNRLQFNSDKAFKIKSVPKLQKIGLKENETLDDVIEECIRLVLGSRRSVAFARSRPLMEMGLDSLELLELRALMSQRLGVELEPTFFFQYGTYDAIARYFKGTEGEDVRTPLLNLDEQKSEGGYDSDLSEDIDNSEDLIAIIGMSCRFPGGVNSPAQYWSVLRHGINAIVEVPSYRWDINHYYAPDPKQPGKISSKYGGFLEQVDQFDAPFFRISPREAAFIDPQQRILLEETWNSLENAGINPESLSGSQTGVFVGIFSHDYELLQVKSNSPDDFNAYLGTGNSASIAAGRLSYFFGFTGPALAVDTACSSSLVAVHLASHSLLRGECDLAVASGVNLLLSPELSIAFSQAGMLSPDGQCKTFDAEANGYVRSEGCGVVVLKRLKKALADNDNILAVVRGTAINQDGTSSGLTAPNERSQEAVIQKALSMAKVSPKEVSYVEAHGTGTSLGDPIEVKAIEAVYGQQRDEDNPLVIGSVKTNIGHAEAASGIAGLIKVVLSMQNKYIPPHLHFKQLNPHMTLDGIPAVIPTVGIEWKRSQSGRRLAGVSSFGFSGTNAHVVLEEAPVRARVQARFERNRHLLTLSAKSEKALLELAQRYEDFFATHPESSLADVCFTANVGRSHFEYRLAVVAESNLQLRDELTAFATSKETFKLVSGRVNSTKSPLIAFLFTGQGSQYIGMGRQLYELSPTFRQTLDRCDSIVRPYLDEPLLSVLYPEPGKTSPINETAYTQPALFALEYALAELWQSWGIKPTAVMGHSVGEYVAATVAGVFSLEDGLKLMAARGRLMQALPSDGEMVAANASELQVAPVIQPYLQEVAIAALNGPDSVVISGKRSTIRLVVAQLEAMGINTTPLQVSHAFHSPLIEPMLEEFARVASEVNYSLPQINLISNVTGELASAQVATPEYWCRHVRQPVQFAAGMEALYRAGYEVFVECGPKPILLGMGRKCLPEGVGRWLPSLRPGQEDWQQILQSLAQLYVEGVQVDWSGFDRDYGRRKVTLPTYPFQRQRYWIEKENSPRDTKKSGKISELQNNITLQTMRRTKILSQLRSIIAKVFLVSPSEVKAHVPWLEMGADSILLMESVRNIENTYGIKITIRQLFEELSTLDAIATYIDQNLSPEFDGADSPLTEPKPAVQPQQLDRSAFAEPTMSARLETEVAKDGVRRSETLLERIMAQQLQVMSQQLEILRGNTMPPQQVFSSPNGQSFVTTQTTAPTFQAPQTPKQHQFSETFSTAEIAPEQTVSKAHTPRADEQLQTSGLSPQQMRHLEALIDRYTKRTQKSKQQAQACRPIMGDSRAVAGFRLSTKEMLYPIVGERAQGSRFWDVDGNEYVDITMGFGVLLFGHAAPFITEALEEQIKLGIQIGPQSNLVEEVAQLICELTGMERVTFCSTGTEAVMTALRLARTATGRTKIALFASSYHGHFDGILATRADGELSAVPSASGISPHAVKDVLVLDYGNPESINILQAHAHELAAVLVEPVQSRRLDLQPKEFLQQLRQLTQATGTALIFDEIITGFRVHPAGAQAWFGIEADIVTYGKIVGGGMPIGVVAGKANYIDGIDGGLWNYGDASYPQAEKTFFAGTFNKNHLGMAAGRAVFKHLKKQGPALQQHLNQRTSQLAQTLNAYFEQEDVPIRIVHFGSQFRFAFSGNLDLLFYHLLSKGIYIWEGRSCFLSTAHTDEDIERIILAVKESIEEMRSGGFLPEPPSDLPQDGKRVQETSKNLTDSPKAVKARPFSTLSSTLNNTDFPLVRVSRTENLPLSFAQERLWFLSQLEPTNPFYNELQALRLHGFLNVAALEKSLNRIIQHHEALRTYFATVDGQPVQVIAESLTLSVPLVDFQYLPESEREISVQRFATAEAQRPFDLASVPLIRVTLLKLTEIEHVLLLTIHHIVFDGWSWGIILRELATIYSAFCNDLSPELPELSIQYKDFAVWQRQWLTKEVLSSQLAYCNQQLEGAPALLELPTDRVRPSIQSFRGAHQRFALSKELSRALVSLSQREGVTLFMTLLAAFQTLLYRYTGQTDICVGTPHANRSRSEIDSLIGFFVNTLVLRTCLSGNPSFEDLLSRVRDVTLLAYAHQDLPFEKLVEELKLERDLSYTPLVQVMLVLDVPMPQTQMDGLTVSPLGLETTTAKFDLTLSLENTPSGLIGTWEYNTDLFDAATIARMARHFQTLLEGIVTNPQQKISSLPLLSEAERYQLLVEWNNTTKDYPSDKCIHQLFEEQVERSPDAIAVVFEEEQLTYRELNQRANRIAHYLKTLGVEPEVLVGICVERSLEMMVGLLGILKAGGAYVPLDPQLPQERLSFMLSDSSVPVMLTQSKLMLRLPENKARVVCLDTDWGIISHSGEENPVSSVGPENLAYIIYTSGSTGQPKGTLIIHQGLVNYLTWCTEAYAVADGSGSPVHSSIGFDATITSLFSPLLVGKKVVLLPEKQEIEALGAILCSQSQFSLVKITPAHLDLLSFLIPNWSADNQTKAFIIGGEALSGKSVSFWRESAPSTKLINEYGPTETVVGCCVYEVDAQTQLSGGIPIGRPIANTQLYILDPFFQPVPIGVLGELYIGGAGVARGYLNRPDLTESKFIPNPFSNEPGLRLYKTGDKTRYLPDGNIEFKGRLDNQVKIRGFRIELGEIETVLTAHPEVREAVVIDAEDNRGNKRLVAYVVARSQSEIKNQLRDFLKQKLPDYMVPGIFVILDALPLTPNGKVDRRALPAPSLSNDSDSLVFPRTSNEEILAGVWKDVLGLEIVGVHDNFFELGGDSIISLQIIARANQAGLQITTKQLFQNQTIASLAAVASTTSSIKVEQGLVTGVVPLTPIQHWFFDQNWSEPHHFNQSMLLVVPPDLKPELLSIALKELMVHHDVLRMRFVLDESGWQQRNTDICEPAPFQVMDLSTLEVEEHKAAVEQRAAELQTTLNLASGSLLRVVLFNLGSDRPSRLLLIIHHLVVDGVSWRILLEDIATAYKQLSRQEAIQLPPKTTSFKDWAIKQRDYGLEPVLELELDYWQAQSSTDTTPLPVDFPDGIEANTEGSTAEISVFLSAEETRTLLQEVPSVYNTQINDVLLTALVQTFARWTGSDNLLIALEGHGREELFDDVDLSRTVGWFTTIFPVLLQLGEADSPGVALKSIKEQLRRIPNRGIGYGILRYLNQNADIGKQLCGLTTPSLCFNYLGQFDQVRAEPISLGFAQENPGRVYSPLAHRSHLLDAIGQVVEGKLQMIWIYSENIHRRSTIERLATEYNSALKALIAHCQSPDSGGYTPTDFPLADLGQQELDELLSEID